MDEKEYRELKVGDKVSAFVFDKKCTAIVESIEKDTGKCIARILNPPILKFWDYCGTILRCEPATKIAIIEAHYRILEIVKEEK